MHYELFMGAALAEARAAVENGERPRGAAAVLDEALVAKETGEKKVILFNLSGHGYFDMTSYQRYLSGQLEDYEYPAEEVKHALEAVEA